MIVTLGSSSVDQEKVGSVALEVAINLSKLGLSTAYIGKISSDEGGRLILDTLIDNIVFFEPHLCSAEEPTALGLNYAGSACAKVNEAEILDGFESIADLQCVFVDAVGLALEPCGTEIEKIIKNLDPDVAVVLDTIVPEGVNIDTSAFVERIGRLKPYSDLVLDEKQDIPEILKNLADNQFKVEELH